MVAGTSDEIRGLLCNHDFFATTGRGWHFVLDSSTPLSRSSGDMVTSNATSLLIDAHREHPQHCAWDSLCCYHCVVGRSKEVVGAGRPVDHFAVQHPGHTIRCLEHLS